MLDGQQDSRRQLRQGPVIPKGRDPRWSVLQVQEEGLQGEVTHRWAQVPVLTELVQGASRELVELHITGPLSQPTVRARPFRGIREEFTRLFKRKKPKEIQSAQP